MEEADAYALFGPMAADTLEQARHYDLVSSSSPSQFGISGGGRMTPSLLGSPLQQQMQAPPSPMMMMTRMVVVKQEVVEEEEEEEEEENYRRSSNNNLAAGDSVVVGGIRNININNNNGVDGRAATARQPQKEQQKRRTSTVGNNSRKKVGEEDAEFLPENNEDEEEDEEDDDYTSSDNTAITTTTNNNKKKRVRRTIKSEQEEDKDYVPQLALVTSSLHAFANNNNNNKRARAVPGTRLAGGGGGGVTRVKPEPLFDNSNEDALRIRRSTYTAVACQTCRARKRKCDGKFPCSHCLATGQECKFAHVGKNQEEEVSPEVMQQYLLEINRLQEEVRVLRILKAEPLDDDEEARLLQEQEEEEEEAEAEQHQQRYGNKDGRTAVIPHSCASIFGCGDEDDQAQRLEARAATAASPALGSSEFAAMPPRRRRQPIPRNPLPVSTLDALAKASSMAMAELDLSHVINDTYYALVEPIVPILSQADLVAGKYQYASPADNLGAFCVWNAMVLLGAKLSHSPPSDDDNNNNHHHHYYNRNHYLPQTTSSSSSSSSSSSTYPPPPPRSSDNSSVITQLETVVRSSFKEMFDVDTPDRARSLLLYGVYHLCSGDNAKAAMFARHAQALDSPIPALLQASATTVLHFAGMGGTNTTTTTSSSSSFFTTCGPFDLFNFGGGGSAISAAATTSSTGTMMMMMMQHHQHQCARS